VLKIVTELFTFSSYCLLYIASFLYCVWLPIWRIKLYILLSYRSTSKMYTITYCHRRNSMVARSVDVLERQQVVKVIWHNVASPRHTDRSIVFARLCQCAHPPRRMTRNPTPVHLPNDISIGSAFLHSSSKTPYTLQRAASFPQNCRPSHGTGIRG